MINSDSLWVIVSSYYEDSDIELYESKEEAEKAMESDEYTGIEYRHNYKVISFEDYLDLLITEAKQDSYEEGYDSAECECE